MRPRLIVDCGGRIVSALIVTAEGRLLPCSQEVRQTAMRHLPSEIAFDARATETPGFSWDEAIEAVAKAQPHQFFERARRIGLRRSWDAELAPEALPLASPLAVLSSPAALADPVVAPLLPAVGVAMLGALLDPLFAFAAARGARAPHAEAVAILPASAGRLARRALQKVFRRRGFTSLSIVPREIAAAMLLAGTAATECSVWDVGEEGLHVHRVAIDADGSEQRFATVASTTIRSLSRVEWLQRIAAAIREDAEARQLLAPAPALVDRALTAFIAGAPQPSGWRMTRALLDAALGDRWHAERVRDVVQHLDPTAAPLILLGDMAALDPVRRVLLHVSGCAERAPACDVPTLDRLVRGVAAATAWQRGQEDRRIVIRPNGTLRINNLRQEAVEIVACEQLPRPGEHCCVRTELAMRGDAGTGKPFLAHLLWGADPVPEGNATVCAMRIDPEERFAGTVRVAMNLRRSRSGSRWTGTVEIRGGAAPVRSRFVQELPQFPQGGQ